MSDACHHHLALGCLLIWSFYMYLLGFRGFEYRLKLIDLGLFNFNFSGFLKSFHFQISLSLLMLGSVLSIVSQVLYVCFCLAYLSYNITFISLVYVYHC